MSDPSKALKPAYRDARARDRELRDERVQAIVDRMLAGEWQGGRDYAALAAEWGVSPYTIGEYAREASGIVRVVTSGQADAMRAELLAQVDRYRLQAEVHGRQDVRGVKVALDAVDLRMRALGLFPAQKVEMVTKYAWERLSLPEKRQRLEAAKARIAELEAELAREEEPVPPPEAA